MSIPRATLLLSTLAILAAGPARALPFFFDGPGGVGFDPASPAIAAAPKVPVGAGSTWLSAGSPALDPALHVTTALVAQPTVPADPSFLDPIRATVRYTVTNTTGLILDGAYLVFTLGAVAAWPEVEPDELGIDQIASPDDPDELLVLLSAAPYVFGAVALPSLFPGAVHSFDIVHVVADSIAPSTVIPTPGLSLLLFVPEPALALLLLPPVALLLRRQLAVPVRRRR